MASVVRETPARRKLPLPGGNLSYLEWGYDDPGKTPLHFAHANGFNALTYQRILSALGDEFHVRAWDARGHGATTLAADPATHRNWYVYRDDLIAMAEDFVQATGRKIILAGHSMGGAASIMAAAARPDLVRGLVLIDPVTIPTGARMVMQLWRVLGLKGNPLADGAEKRRAVFADRATMVERYTGRGAFRTWPREFVEDYVEGGTRIREDGEVELLCAPAWEAANFRAQGHNITTAVRNLHVPFAMLYAEHGSTCRPPFPMLLKRRDPRAQVTQIRGATHFLPMEFPKLVIDEVRAFRDRLEREGR